MSARQNPSSTRLLTVPEVASRLALSKEKVWRLVWSGELYSVKIGSARRIPEAAVDQYVDGQG